jgi:CHAT domain-containing protein
MAAACLAWQGVPASRPASDKQPDLRRMIRDADALLAQGGPAEAVDMYHAALHQLGVRLAANGESYDGVRDERAKDPVLAGEILTKIASAYLSPRQNDLFALPESPQAGERMAERHGKGRVALDASIALLEAARARFLQVGLFPIHERLSINRKLRVAYDLQIQDHVELWGRLGGNDLLFFAFAKVLQSRSRCFLEALWLRRSVPRLLPSLPSEFGAVYYTCFDSQVYAGYLRSALLSEMAEKDARADAVQWLKERGTAATAQVREATEKLLAHRAFLDAALTDKLSALSIYPSHEIGAGGLARSTLSQRDVVLQYHVTGQHVLAFVYPCKPELTSCVYMETLPVAPDVLTADVRNYLARMRSKSPLWKDLSQKLYLEIFAPLAPYLGRRDRIFIVPSGVLNYLPFQTLLDPRTGEPATRDINISVLPHFELLGELMQPRTAGKRPSRALVVGAAKFSSAPALLLGEAEARSVAATIGNSADLYLASKRETAPDSILRLMPGRSVIHVSSHARFDRRPLYSRIILPDGEGQDAALTGFDLLRPGFRLDGGLVTLSACDSGVVQVDEGEETFGLNSALILAGAQAVVSSLWPVEERSTGLLMRKFYNELNRGIPADTALYRAEQWLRTSYPEYSHPHYWGAFVVTGDGRFQLTP